MDVVNLSLSLSNLELFKALDARPFAKRCSRPELPNRQPQI